MPFDIKKTAAIKNTVIAAIASLAMIATTAVPAEAGKRERDFLKGVVATVAVGAVVNHLRNQQAQQRYTQPQYLAPTRQPQYYAPAPQTQYRAPTPTYANVGRVVGAPTYTAPRYQQHSVYSTPAAQTFNGFNAQTRRTIQQRLAYYGYYTGSIDGAWGPRTSAAVEAYARDNGMLSGLSSPDAAYGVYSQIAG